MLFTCACTVLPPAYYHTYLNIPATTTFSALFACLSTYYVYTVTLAHTLTLTPTHLELVSHTHTNNLAMKNVSPPNG